MKKFSTYALPHNILYLIEVRCGDRPSVITMPLDLTRYPDNWTDLALKVKEAAEWKCQCCGHVCYRPGERPGGKPRSEWTADILQVHHRNHKPEDNRLENLMAGKYFLSSRYAPRG